MWTFILWLRVKGLATQCKVWQEESLFEAMLPKWWTYFNYSCIFYAITSLPEIYLILFYLILAYSPESSESPESLLCQNHQKHYNQQNCQNQSGFKVTLLHLWDFLCCAFLNVSTNGLKENFHFYLNVTYLKF